LKAQTKKSNLQWFTHSKRMFKQSRNFSFSYSERNSYYSLKGCLGVYLFVFLFGGTGIWIQVSSHLTRQLFYHLSHASSLLCLGYFWGRVLQTFFFARADLGTIILLFYTSYHCWDDRHMPPPSYWLRWSLVNFLPGLKMVIFPNLYLTST
jgi:hypothetical protein